MRERLSGWATGIDMGGDECPSPGRWPTSDAKYRRKSGKEHRDGPRKESIGRSLRCRKLSGQTDSSVKEAGRTIPPTHNGALPHRAIPEMDGERGHGGVRVVLVQDTDTGPSVQELQTMEDTAESSVDRGAERREEGGTVSRSETCSRRPADPGLPAHHEGGKQGGTASSASETGEDRTKSGGAVDGRTRNWKTRRARRMRRSRRREQRVISFFF